MCHRAWHFHMGPGDQTQVQMLVQHTLYQLSHLPGPTPSNGFKLKMLSETPVLLDFPGSVLEAFVRFLALASSLVPSSLLPLSNDISPPPLSSLFPMSPAGMVPKEDGWFPSALLPLKDRREDEWKNKQSVCFLVLEQSLH